jgi:uncharacterized protein (UPF0332 family)
MPISSLDLLALAKLLQTSGANEVALRCSVSRAYYSALHCVAEVFEPREPSDQRERESSHVEIIARAEVYAKGPNPARSCASEIAKMWPKFKRLRVRADYRLDQEVPASESAESILRCERVMALCGEVMQKRELSTPFRS